jgi:hypothetical protein
MTLFEKTIWAAAYAESLARQRVRFPDQTVLSPLKHDTVWMSRNAIREADEAVLTMREVISADRRLHMNETLEQERLAEEV